jgi:cell shape-determining protein MreC
MNPTLSIQSKYVRPLLAAVCVFACCFLVLKFWLNLQSIAAAVAAGISAVGTFFGAVLGLVKTALEIEKLKHENRKLKREEAEALRIVRSPTLEEIDKYGLKPRPFVSDTHEEHL